MAPPDRDKQESALGALLGACVGDAAGAVLEFLGRKPDERDVQRALSMPGGGVLRVAKGQITDDGELTLCLAQALSSGTRFDRERIARSYAEWVRSEPFDMGITTRQSLGCFLDPPWLEVCEKEGVAVAISRAAHLSCQDSKANGSLMRATPLGIWGHRLLPIDLALMAREDSRFSHPNMSCQDAAACYTLAIAHLINHPGDADGAFRTAREWADVNAVAEVRAWLSDAEGNRDIPYHPQIGFVKIAFTQAFRHLHLGTDYVTALRQTLSGGGDTDTNACIVGGLIGAANGAGSIPLEMREAVLNCDTGAGANPRPLSLHASQIPDLVARLLANAPAGEAE